MTSPERGAAPSLSVLMSVYNGRRFLARAIESIQIQTYRDFEFIIVDDASTDGSDAVCREYAESDTRIRVLSNETNKGLAHSLNRASGVATGTYFARMDADDVSLPGRFERQVAYLEAHPEIGLAGCFYHELDGEGRVAEKIVRFPTEPGIIRWRLYFENPIPHPCIVVRRSVFDRVGGYDERWSVSQDYDLFMRISRVSRLTNLPEVLYHWRVHDRSVTRTRNEDQRLAALSISKAAIDDALGGARDAGVSDSLVETIWNRALNGRRAAVEVSGVLYRLCERILSEPRWTPEERRALRTVVATKLFYYLRPYMSDPATWPMAARVARLSPAAVWDLTRSWFGRTLLPDA